METKNIPNYKKTIFRQIIDEEYLPSGVHEEFLYTVHSNKSTLKQAIELIAAIKNENSKERNLKLLEFLILRVSNEFEDEQKVNKPLDI